MAHNVTPQVNQARELPKYNFLEINEPGKMLTYNEKGELLIKLFRSKNIEETIVPEEPVKIKEPERSVFFQHFERDKEVVNNNPLVVA